VLPAVQAVAMKHSEVKLVDLYNAFLNHNEFFMGMSDGQTNAMGEVEIEQLVYAAMQTTQNGAGGSGGAGGTAGSGGAAGASAGSGGTAGATTATGAAGASAGSGGATTAGASGSATTTSGGSTSAGGSTTQPIATSSLNASGGCSISAPDARHGLAWLVLAGAFSGLAFVRRTRRQPRS
jgi:hypothetical protein